MNNERTVILENVGGCPVGLKDTQARTYRLAVDAKIRISEVSLQDILDYPASKVFFNEDKVKIKNISSEALYNMGLSEKEIAQFLIGEQPAVVVTPVIEEKPYEEVIEEEVIVIEEPAVVEQPVRKAPAKNTKKGSGKKQGNLKTK